MCQPWRGSSELSLRAAIRPTWKLPWCPLQDQKNLWHWTQRCERWKGRCLLPETSSQLLASEQIPLHTAGTGLLLPVTSPGRPERTQSFALWKFVQSKTFSTQHTVVSERRDFLVLHDLVLKCFARRFPTKFNYSKSFQNSTAPSLLSCFANLFHGLTIASLTLVPSSSAKPSNLKSHLQFHSFSMANMKPYLSGMPTLLSLLLATGVPVLSDLLTLALNYLLTILLRALHSELLGDVRWFLFHFASHTAWEGNLSPTPCSEHHAWSRLWTWRVWGSPGRASMGLLILSDSVLKAHIVSIHSQVSYPAYLRLSYRNVLPLFMALFYSQVFWNVGIPLPQMWVMVILKWAQNAWLPRSGHLSPYVWAQILTQGGSCALLKKDDQIQGWFGGQDYLSCLFS